ncbi:hypothetical protein GCM10025873_01470 [Demequina sediminis]|nr:hypothetical protein GCM10025873_01470 [Demequina sediminis]
MRVAHVRERVGHLDGDVERRALSEVTDVDVAAVRTGGTEWARSAVSVATPMMPRNGASGKDTARSPPSVSGRRPRHSPSASREMGVKTLTSCGPAGISPANAPRPWRLEITP